MLDTAATLHSPVPVANRLQREKSPYLLQHQFNPVDWYAWGEEAFARARRERKPIFLSIGYSTCHWCHVMERESFEDAEVAQFLNEHFVSIKVDREERPDVDKIYMTFVQAAAGSGGWPLNVFLMPDLKPFYGGTYFPPAGKHGRPGFLDVLRHIQQIWQQRRGEVASSAAEMHCRLAGYLARKPSTAPASDPDILANAAARLKEDYEPRHGGFSQAPKFPRPSHPAFLLRWSRRSGDEAARRMVLHTCDRMAAGGIRDHLGGGFARYSVDSEWLVPHFEKMLYDNAQLVQLYLDAHLVSGDARHADVVRDVIGYVLRDMTHPLGGFYSAEDADSEGKEGKFYCWTLAELRRLLSPEECAVAVRHFGVTERGNFVDHSDPDPLPNQNVLSIVDPHLSPTEAHLLASAKARLFDARSRRVRPHLDDKILTSWNGLMLGALARAGVVLREPAWLKAARRNLRFLQEHLGETDGGALHHRWRDGERDEVQLLDDYAFVLAGVLDFYQATLEAPALEFAVRLADAMLARFHDAEAGGFWQAEGRPDLILRVKEDYDGAEPSGNSVAIQGLLTLAEITGRTAYRDVAVRSLDHFQNRLEQLPQALPHMLAALDDHLSPRQRVVIAGEPGSPDGQALLAAAHAGYRPGLVVMGTSGPVNAAARAHAVAGGKATAHVCGDGGCQAPIHEPEELRRRLG